jgi:hypothetical protein
MYIVIEFYKKNVIYTTFSQFNFITVEFATDYLQY